MARKKKTGRKRGYVMVNFPKGCMSPNQAGAQIGVTGECIKQYIYAGKLRAAKLDNGYYAIRQKDLDEFLNRKPTFKFHKGTTPRKKKKK